MGIKIVTGESSSTSSTIPRTWPTTTSATSTTTFRQEEVNSEMNSSQKTTLWVCVAVFVLFLIYVVAKEFIKRHQIKKLIRDQIATPDVLSRNEPTRTPISRGFIPRVRRLNSDGFPSENSDERNQEISDFESSIIRRMAVRQTNNNSPRANLGTEVATPRPIIEPIVFLRPHRVADFPDPPPSYEEALETDDGKFISDIETGIFGPDLGWDVNENFVRQETEVDGPPPSYWNASPAATRQERQERTGFR